MVSELDFARGFASLPLLDFVASLALVMTPLLIRLAER